MNQNKTKWTCGALLLSAAIGGFTACSDDHYSINGDVAGRNTVWENIQANPQLTQFASILDKVHVSKNENSTTPQTYADLLNHSQTFTVWAPANGTFDYEKWNALLEEGTTESAYKVEKELIRNCMSRYTYPLSGNDSTILNLFNSKTATFNYKNSTISGQKITESNIGSSNGMLHVIEGSISYLPNIYDYIMDAEGIDSLRSIIKHYETVEFDENASTQGPTVNGNITWVDSVTYKRNQFTSYFMAANLTQEDSTYSVILPNNNAWNGVRDKYMKYFHYMPEYVQTIKSVSDDGTESSEQKTIRMSDAEIDSLQKLNVASKICQDLVFNNNLQFKHTADQFAVAGACDSLRSTNYTVFYDPNSAALFDGQTPTRLSNGYAYIVNNYNYNPVDNWLTKRKVTAWSNTETYSYCTPNPTRINRSVTYTDEQGESRDTTIDLTVLQLTPTRSTANTSATIAIKGLYSCKYDIYVVMTWNSSAAKPYHFRSYINYHKGQKTSTRAQLTPPEGQLADGRNYVTREPYVDEDGYHMTDTVLLAKDFELPVSYYGVSDAYVTVEINSYLTSSQRSQYTNELLIDKIILVPKWEEE